MLKYTEKDSILYDTDAIKIECPSCDAEMDYSEARYESRGNWCEKCNAECDRKSKTLTKEILERGIGGAFREVLSVDN